MNKKYVLSSIVLLLFVITCVDLYSQRQNKMPYTRLGIRAGFNMSDLTSAKGLDLHNGLAFYNSNMEYIGITDTKPFKYGFNVGITSQIQMNKDWFFSPSLIYTTKGYKVFSQDLDISANAHYIQIPIDFTYKYSLNKDLRLIAQAGAFLGLGIVGKTYFTDEKSVLHVQSPNPSASNNYTAYDKTVHGIYGIDESNTFGADGTYIFDAGLQVAVGFEFARFQFLFSYQYSLMPLYSYNYDYSSRYEARGIEGVNNSLEYFNSRYTTQIDKIYSPHQHMFSFTLSYFFDNLDIQNKYRY